MDLLLVEDHALVREGLQMLVDGTHLFAHTIACGSMTAALHESHHDSSRFGLVMLDLDLPDSSGLDTLDRMRAALPNVPVLIVSAEDQSATVERAFERGARGYVPKNASGSALRGALQRVLQGESYVPCLTPTTSCAAPPVLSMEEGESLVRLTARQTEVLLLLAKGQTNKEIANLLDLSLSTVRVHVSAVLDRLGVENRTQAAISPTAHALLAERGSSASNAAS